jgi:hypothetical protein
MDHVATGGMIVCIVDAAAPAVPGRIDVQPATAYYNVCRADSFISPYPSLLKYGRLAPPSPSTPPPTTTSLLVASCRSHAMIEGSSCQAAARTAGLLRSGTPVDPRLAPNRMLVSNWT